MKKLNVKRMMAVASAALVTLQTGGVRAFASSGQPEVGFTKVVEPIMALLDEILWPLIGVVGAVGALYCVILGIKFAKAEEPQDREKAKSHLKNALIGFILIFVLMVVLKLLLPAMTTWVRNVSAAQ